MGEKKNKVLELAKLNPNMKRCEIARQAGCSPARVTYLLGATRPYNRKVKSTEETPETV